VDPNEPSGFFVPVSNDGQMTVEQMKDALPRDQVVPILVVEWQGKRFVPLFTTMRHAWDFARRNAGENCNIGTWGPSQGDLQQLHEEGVEVRQMPFPAKRTVSVLPFTLKREVEVRVYSG
jgi:hypothetical protein